MGWVGYFSNGGQGRSERGGEGREELYLNSATGRGEGRGQGRGEARRGGGGEVWSTSCWLTVLIRRMRFHEMKFVEVRDFIRRMLVWVRLS